MKRKLPISTRRTLMRNAAFDAAEIMERAAEVCGVDSHFATYPLDFGNKYGIVFIKDNEGIYKEDLQDFINLLDAKCEARKLGDYSLTDNERRDRTKHAISTAGYFLWYAMMLQELPGSATFQVKQNGKTYSIKIVDDGGKLAMQESHELNENNKINSCETIV